MSGRTGMVPCRLFGLLATEAPRAVLLRRGPSRWVQQILWHTATDTFEAGQWFCGRIYEWGCDLSPDGTLLVYLARKAETPERRRSSTTHKWTALSHPPYFTAMALWPCGDTWDGGGVFLSHQHLWLCHDWRHLPHKQHRWRQVSVEASFRPERFEERARRHGWELVQPGAFTFAQGGAGSRGGGIHGVTKQAAVWQKCRADRRYCLVQETYREPDFSYETLTYVVDASNGQQYPLEETTWVEWDQSGRLVFARDGKLFASRERAGLPWEVEQIADFNGNTPTSVLAPYQTKRW